MEGIQFERNLAHILGAATGALLGGDFDMASLTASNAIDNNSLYLYALRAFTVMGAGAKALLRRGGATAGKTVIKGRGEIAKAGGSTGSKALAGRAPSAAVESGKAAGGAGARALPKAAIHGNSKAYGGRTDVYGLYEVGGTAHKVGESMQGFNSYGKLKRAETQIRQLYKDTGKVYRAKLLASYPTKAAARVHETKHIVKSRGIYGPGALPGNKGTR